MSLSAWEQQALVSIENGLAESDPALAVLLTTFTQMVSGEEMPAVEEIVVVSWSRVRRALRKRRRRRLGGLRRCLVRTCRRLGFRWVALSLWLVVTVSLVCIALFLSSGSRVSCSGSWRPVCAAPTSPPATHKVAVSHVPASTAATTP
jgi:hypothetical protein